jgi:sodium/hydrogen exchanger 10/11
VENDFKVEIGVLLVAVYACFSFSEPVAGVSGVLAVVTFGLLMGRKGKYAFGPAAAAVADSVMLMLAHFSETMIFFVAGIATWTSVSMHKDVIKVRAGSLSHAFALRLSLCLILSLSAISRAPARAPTPVWHEIPLYLMLAVVRLVGTLALYPLLRRTGYSINLKECVLIVYAGLRGAVGLALGLLVYQNKHMRPIDRDRIHFLVGCCPYHGHQR